MQLVIATTTMYLTNLPFGSADTRSTPTKYKGQNTKPQMQTSPKWTNLILDLITTKMHNENINLPLNSLTKDKSSQSQQSKKTIHHQNRRKRQHRDQISYKAVLYTFIAVSYYSLSRWVAALWPVKASQLKTSILVKPICSIFFYAFTIFDLDNFF